MCATHVHTYYRFIFLHVETDGERETGQSGGPKYYNQVQQHEGHGLMDTGEQNKKLKSRNGSTVFLTTLGEPSSLTSSTTHIIQHQCVRVRPARLCGKCVRACVRAVRRMCVQVQV
jgi:hypothetical protein